ncbi:MAG TPA: hypothetical protein VFD91_11030, partial [Mariniphaga sp.]|nr:hypothetical protein [Mariniphaga sp.]
ILTGLAYWQRGTRKEFIVKSVQATANTTVSVLGQSGEVVEYQPSTDGKAYFEQKTDGLNISCVRAQRIYNNNKWPNPLVLKLTNVIPALDPPAVVTVKPVRSESGDRVVFKGQILKTGNAESLKAGFQYREYAGFVEELYSDEWKETKTIQISETGAFEIEPDLKMNGKEYQVRAFVDHPKLRVTGEIERIRF